MTNVSEILAGAVEDANRRGVIPVPAWLAAARQALSPEGT